MNRRWLLPLAAASALAACSHGPKTPLALPSTQPAAASEVEAIVQLLNSGQKDEAKKRVRAALKRDSNNASFRVLSDSIDKDPKELLGPDSFSYTVRSGDTMIGLAQRFLGNRLKAYQLARYNGVEVPQSLAIGQVLRIPGEPPRIELPRKLPPAPRTAAPAQRAKPVAPKPVAAASNPIAAQRLRAAGLAALNAGTPVRAVMALRRAAALDPGNPLIARDLARAERIAATVRARR
jgi:LysM repeat protein